MPNDFNPTEWVNTSEAVELTGYSRAYFRQLIQPTQWNAPNREVVDHVVDLINLIPSLKVEQRVSCPHATQQYNAQQVNWAKENKNCLYSHVN